jgi:hypothetical protein
MALAKVQQPIATMSNISKIKKLFKNALREEKDILEQRRTKADQPTNYGYCHSKEKSSPKPIN